MSEPLSDVGGMKKLRKKEGPGENHKYARNFNKEYIV
jgi:hypothetical protein